MAFKVPVNPEIPYTGLGHGGAASWDVSLICNSTQNSAALIYVCGFAVAVNIWLALLYLFTTGHEVHHKRSFWNVLSLDYVFSYTVFFPCLHLLRTLRVAGNIVLHSCGNSTGQDLRNLFQDLHQALSDVSLAHSWISLYNGQALRYTDSRREPFCTNSKSELIQTSLNFGSEDHHVRFYRSTTFIPLDL